MGDVFIIGGSLYLALSAVFLLFGPVKRQVVESVGPIVAWDANTRIKVVLFHLIVKAAAVLIWPIFFFMGKTPKDHLASTTKNGTCVTKFKR